MLFLLIICTLTKCGNIHFYGAPVDYCIVTFVAYLRSRSMNKCMAFEYWRIPSSICVTEIHDYPLISGNEKHALCQTKISN